MVASFSENVPVSSWPKYAKRRGFVMACVFITALFTLGVIEQGMPIYNGVIFGVSVGIIVMLLAWVITLRDHPRKWSEMQVTTDGKTIRLVLCGVEHVIQPSDCRWWVGMSSECDNMRHSGKRKVVVLEVPIGRKWPMKRMMRIGCGMTDETRSQWTVVFGKIEDLKQSTGRPK